MPFATFLLIIGNKAINNKENTLFIMMLRLSKSKKTTNKTHTGIINFHFSFTNGIHRMKTFKNEALWAKLIIPSDGG